MAVNSNVKDFLSRINQGVKPNLFYVDISFPTGLANQLTGTDKELQNLLCKSEIGRAHV